METDLDNTTQHVCLFQVLFKRVAVASSLQTSSSRLKHQISLVLLQLHWMFSHIHVSHDLFTESVSIALCCVLLLSIHQRFHFWSLINLNFSRWSESYFQPASLQEAQRLQHLLTFVHYTFMGIMVAKQQQQYFCVWEKLQTGWVGFD